MAYKPDEGSPEAAAQPDEDDGYRLGYGRPPKSGQFQKGVSGNKRGRPKGSKSFASIVREGLAKKIEVKVDGKLRTLTLAEAVVTRTLREAAGGNRRAADQSLRLMDRYGEFENEESDDEALALSENLTYAELAELQRLTMKGYGKEQEHLAICIEREAAALAEHNARWGNANVPYDNSDDEISI